MEKVTKTLLKIVFLLYFSFLLVFISKFYILFLIFFVLLFFSVRFRTSIPFMYMVFLMLPLFFLFGLTNILEYGLTADVLVYSFRKAGTTVLKLLDLLVLNFLFIKNLSFSELKDTFSRLRFSDNFFFLVMMLISVLPVIFKTASQIYLAQRLRGLNKRDFLKIKGWILFLSPLLVHVFSYSEQLFLQFELQKNKKTMLLHENTAGFKDYLLFVFFTTFLTILFFG